MIYKLAILICSLEEREGQLKGLLRSIGQHPKVIVLTEIDKGVKKGGLPTGTKRNILLNRAKEAGAEYVAFVDDDDKIMPDYLGSIMQALELNPDVVGFKGFMTTNGQRRQEFRISVKFPYEQRGNVYFRYNNHLSPIKTEIALQIKFPDVTWAEDSDYAKRLHESGLITSEVYINKFLYHYDYKSRK